MKVLTADPPPAEMDEVLARRQALGQDLYDEMWEGVYHMNPVPHAWHGVVQTEVGAILREAVEVRPDWIASGPFNLGDKDNYRVPDGGVLMEPTQLYMPTALIVVEIVSEGDETFDKFDFYWDHNVNEILTISRPQVIRWWERRSHYSPGAESDLLSLSVQELRERIHWPTSA